MSGEISELLTEDGDHELDAGHENQESEGLTHKLASVRGAVVSDSREGEVSDE